MFKPTKRYWSALGALYGDNVIPIAPPKPRKKRRKDEEIEQKKYHCWAATLKLPWFHPANGGSRHELEAKNLKDMGVKKGIPDIVLPLPRSFYHGLVIELKRIDGKMSDLRPEQILWLNWFAHNGWYSCVAFGFEQAKKFTEDYLYVSTGRGALEANEKWFDLEMDTKVSLLDQVRTRC